MTITITTTVGEISITKTVTIELPSVTPALVREYVDALRDAAEREEGPKA